MKSVFFVLVYDGKLIDNGWINQLAFTPNKAWVYTTNDENYFNIDFKANSWISVGPAQQIEIDNNYTFWRLTTNQIKDKDDAVYTGNLTCNYLAVDNDYLACVTSSNELFKKKKDVNAGEYSWVSLFSFELSEREKEDGGFFDSLDSLSFVSSF